MKGQEINPIQLSQEANEYATTVEASCWSPRLHISDEEFHQLIIQKTQDLCNILIQRSCQPIQPFPPIALPQPKKVKKVQAISVPPETTPIFQPSQIHPACVTPPSFSNVSNVILPSITELPIKKHVTIPSISSFDQNLPQKDISTIFPPQTSQNFSQTQFEILVPSPYIVNIGS